MSVYIVAIHEKWGDRPCDHPDYEWERSDFGGQKTGDIYCSQCGELFAPSDAAFQRLIDAHRAKMARPHEDAVQAARRVVDEALGERPKTKK